MIFLGKTINYMSQTLGSSRKGGEEIRRGYDILTDCNSKAKPRKKKI
jgi:hypothetical protein